jgi:hypothetical protein
MLPVLYLLTVSLAVSLVSVWLVQERSVPISFALALAGAVAGGVFGTVAGVALEVVSIGNASVTPWSGAILALLGAVAAAMIPSLVS